MSKEDRKSKHLDRRLSKQSEERSSRLYFDEVPTPSTRSKKLGSESIKITVENLLALIKATQGDSLDKNSVIESIRGLYDWLTFDPNRHIPLPRAVGSSFHEHMLPHGAIVNTRRQGSVIPDYDDKLYLKDVPEEELRCVARSVVSSSQGGDLGRSSRGRIVREPPESPGYTTSGPSLSSPRDVQGLSDVYRYYEPSPRPLFEQQTPQAPRSTAARFSILGALKESASVLQTPPPSVATKSRRIVRRPKAGAVPKETIDGSDEGIPVQFAD